MTTIAIIGLGLIGGSIGEAIKSKGLTSKIIGIPRREETIREAKQHTAIDEGSLDISKVSEADIVFICTPINLIIPKLREIMPHLKKGAIVTDVGSTKYQIVKAAEKIVKKGCYFVGGHPMAGKETTGIAVSEPRLFEGKTWVLTQTAKTSKKALETLQNLINSLNSYPLILNPVTHDRVVAAISHAPVAVAAALVNTVASQKEKDLMVQCASSGFRDTTRVASGDPAFGLDMFLTNKKAILPFLKSLRASLLDLGKAIKSSDSGKIKAELEKAKQFRDKIYK